MGLNEAEKVQADGISFLGLAFEKPWRHPAVCAKATTASPQLKPGRTWHVLSFA